jgi:hypothetical protein
MKSSPLRSPIAPSLMLTLVALIVSCASAAEQASITTEDLALRAFGDEPAMTVRSEVGHRFELRCTPESLPVRGSNRVQVTALSSADGQLMADLDLVMVPFMPAMGHGSGSQPTGQRDLQFLVTASVSAG